MDEAVSDEGDGAALGLGLRGMRLREESVESSTTSGSEMADGSSSGEETARSRPEPIAIAQHPASASASSLHAQSLPHEASRSWTTQASTRVPTARREESVEPEVEVEKDVVPNPLLDICRSRIDSSGKGALYPGSIFKGTQTSGRSAYEVEVRIVVRSPDLK